MEYGWSMDGYYVIIYIFRIFEDKLMLFNRRYSYYFSLTLSHSCCFVLLLLYCSYMYI